MKKYILIASLLLFNLSFAQKSSLSFDGISVYTGFSTTISQLSQIDDFKKLAPNSTILQTDFSKADINYFGEIQNSSSVFNAYANFNLKNKEGNQGVLTPRFRFGIAFMQNAVLQSNYSIEEKYRIDTLISNRTGQSYFVDSVHKQYYDFNYQQNNLLLSVDFLISTNQERRFFVFAGLGVAAGISFQATTNINTYDSYYIDDFQYGYNDRNRLESFERDGYKREAYANKSSYALNFSSPLGLDFRIGNNGFWKNVHLVTELKPLLLVNNVPEVATYISTGFVNNFGFRFTVN